MRPRNIPLYLTQASDCSYLPGESSSSLIPDPQVDMDMSIYSQLIRLGYRRSGQFTYRPHCDQCQQCISCRVDVAGFSPNRSQKRCRRKNADLSVSHVPAAYSDEYFQLYSRYLAARHPDGEMADPTPQDFENFLYCEWSDTEFLEIRSQSRLLAIAVTDHVEDGLSAVYSFFDTSEPSRSLGTFCILNQIEYASSLGLDYLYLGYWVKDNNKMRYKCNFRPLEMYLDDHWSPVESTSENLDGRIVS